MGSSFPPPLYFTMRCFILFLILPGFLLGQSSDNKNDVPRLTFFINNGVSINRSVLSVSDFSSDSNFEAESRKTIKYSLSVGLTFFTKSKLTYEFGIKRITFGNINTISSLSDSLVLPFSMTSSITRTNFILNFSCGYNYIFKKYFLSIGAGVDYLPNTGLNHSSEGSTGVPDKNTYVFVENHGRSRSNYAFLPSFSSNIGYILNLFNEKNIFVSYRFNYNLGLSTIYYSEMKFTNGKKTYMLSNKNNCGYFAHFLSIAIPIK